MINLLDPDLVVGGPSVPFAPVDRVAGRAGRMSRQASRSARRAPVDQRTVVSGPATVLEP